LLDDILYKLQHPIDFSTFHDTCIFYVLILQFANRSTWWNICIYCSNQCRQLIIHHVISFHTYIISLIFYWDLTFNLHRIECVLRDNMQRSLIYLFVVLQGVLCALRDNMQTCLHWRIYWWNETMKKRTNYRKWSHKRKITPFEWIFRIRG
jgi:hypothetical protein